MLFLTRATNVKSISAMPSQSREQEENVPVVVRKETTCCHFNTCKSAPVLKTLSDFHQ